MAEESFARSPLAQQDSDQSKQSTTLMVYNYKLFLTGGLYINIYTMNDYLNIRSKPTRAPSVPTNEFDVSPPSPAKINDDLKAAVIQMDSIEATRYKEKDAVPRSPAPLPEAISPAGIPIDLAAENEEEEEVGKKRGEFKIDLGSYEVMNEAVDVSIEGNKSTEYKRNGKGSLIIIGLLMLSLHLLSQHSLIFTYVINYESPDLILATVLYFISSLCILFLMLAMLVIPGLSINEAKFQSYYGVVLVAGGLDLVAVMIGGSAFSPLGFYTKDPYSYMTLYWGALIECLLINGLLYYAFTRKSADGKLYTFFHPFVSTLEPTVEEIADENEIVPETEV